MIAPGLYGHSLKEWTETTAPSLNSDFKFQMQLDSTWKTTTITQDNPYDTILQDLLITSEINSQLTVPTTVSPFGIRFSPPECTWCTDYSENICFPLYESFPGTHLNKDNCVPTHNSIEHNITMNLSPGQLIAIRDKLVKSLARVHDLEKQARSIPKLNEIINELTNQLADQTRLTEQLKSRLAQPNPRIATEAMNMVTPESLLPTVHSINEANGTMENRELSGSQRTVNTEPVHAVFNTPKVVTSSRVELCSTHEFGCQTNEVDQSNQSTQTSPRFGGCETVSLVSEIEQFAIDCQLIQDPMFDQKRFYDLVNCCRTNQWRELLLMSNVLSPSRLPLPEPPPNMELFLLPQGLQLVDSTTQTDHDALGVTTIESVLDYSRYVNRNNEQCKSVISTTANMEACCTIVQDNPQVHTTATADLLPFEAVWHSQSVIQTDKFWSFVEWFEISTELIVHNTLLTTNHFYLPFTKNTKITIQTPVDIREKPIQVELGHTVKSNCVKSLARSLVLELQRSLAERQSRRLATCTKRPLLLNSIYPDNNRKILTTSKPTSPTAIRQVVLNCPSFDRLDILHHSTERLMQSSSTNALAVLEPPVTIEFRAATQSLACHKLIEMTEVKPLDEPNLITVTNSVVGRTGTEYPPVVPRRILWYLSIPLKQRQLTSPVEETVIELSNNKHVERSTRPRLALFKSIKLKHSIKKRSPQQELSQNTTFSDSKIDQNHSGQTVQSVTNLSVLSSDVNNPQVSISLPVVNAHLSSESESPHPVVEIKPNRTTGTTHPSTVCEFRESCCTKPCSVSTAGSDTAHLVRIRSRSRSKWNIAINTQDISPTEHTEGSQPAKIRNLGLVGSPLITKLDHADEPQRDNIRKNFDSDSINQTVNRTEQSEESSSKAHKTEFTSIPGATMGLVSVPFLAACQTFAAWLEDSTNISCKAMNDATETVRRSWFEVTSGPEADAERVKAHIQALKCLQSCPIDRVVNMIDQNGNTALHYAVSHARWTVVGVLLTNCPTIDVNIFNRTGYTPPMLAAVVANQPQIPDELHALEQLLTRADLSLRSANPQQQTVLMLAAMHGRIGLVHRLLTMHKAPINQKDAEGSTALMAATEHNRSNVVRLLLSQPEIDASSRDNDGCTALDIALARRHHEIALMIYAKVKIQKLRRDYPPKNSNKTVYRQIPYGHKRIEPLERTIQHQ